MEVQIFGVKKSADTRKAQRFFAERRVKTHFVDLMERAASPGELRRFAQKFGVEAAFSPMVINGGPGLRVEVDGVLSGAVSLTIEDGRVTHIYSIANPDKLARLDAEMTLTR